MNAARASGSSCKRPAPVTLRRRPRYPAIRGEIAQLVEHTTENRGVPGSSPGLAIGRDDRTDDTSQHATGVGGSGCPALEASGGCHVPESSAACSRRQLAVCKDDWLELKRSSQHFASGSLRSGLGCGCGFWRLFFGDRRKGAQRQRGFLLRSAPGWFGGLVTGGTAGRRHGCRMVSHTRPQPQRAVSNSAGSRSKRFAVLPWRPNFSSVA